jgi:hypothetical protein
MDIVTEIQRMIGAPFVALVQTYWWALALAVGCGAYWLFLREGADEDLDLPGEKNDND